MGSTAGTGFYPTAARPRGYSERDPQFAPTPAWSPFIPPEPQQQHHQHPQHAHHTQQQHAAFVWQPRDEVRRPYDSTMRVSTVHISPFTEVTGDGYTAAVGEDTGRHIQVQLARGAQSKHTGHGGHASRPVLGAIPEASPRMYLPQDAHAYAYGEPPVPHRAVLPSTGGGYQVPVQQPAPMAMASSFVPHADFGAGKFGVHEVRCAPLSAPSQPSTTPPSQDHGTRGKAHAAVQGGPGRHWSEREDGGAHRKEVQWQRTWPGTLWDATPIVCLSLLLLLASVGVVLLLSGFFD